MKLLAFETATEACSVALWIDDQVHERFGIVPRQHAELALPWADALLADAGIARSQLDAVAVGRGPGAFTGVRLAVALAQGVAFALDLPVAPVSTLAALAAPFLLPASGEKVPKADEGQVIAAIDARMGEIYVAAFLREGDSIIATSDETVIAPARYQLPDGGGWIGVGSGFAAADDALRSRFGERFASIDAGALPHAADVARLAALAFQRGETVAPERLEPAYLRNNVALTLAEQGRPRR